MKIDWFTVIAQIFNFIILLWLLKKLLFKPILNAISDREEKIRGKIKSAEQKNFEAGKMKNEFQSKKEEFELHKVQLYKQMNEEVESEKRLRLAEVHETVDKISEKLNKNIIEEKESLIDEFVHDFFLEVFSISEKVLVDLSSVSIQEALIDVFIKKMKGGDIDKKSILSTTNLSNNLVKVRSAFELNTSVKDKLEEYIREEIVDFEKISYETVPDLICGLELVISGHRIGWNFKEYLTSFKESVVIDGNT